MTQNSDMAGTIIITIIMYVGLTIALFYGIKEEWDAVFFGLLASFVAFICRRRRDRNGKV